MLQAVTGNNRIWENMAMIMHWWPHGGHPSWGCMQILEDFWCCNTLFFTKFQKMHRKFYMRRRITAAWKFLENFPMHFAKNLCIFYATYKTLKSFCYHFLKKNFSTKINRKFILVFLQNCPGNLEVFPCTLFIITCNQKLSCG